MPTTQKIPLWSANLSANAPKDWQRAIGRKAFELGISAGELVRRLLIAGAQASFPAMGRSMVAAHRKYYPKRALCGVVLLTVFGVATLAGQHHGKDLRVARAIQRAKVNTETF
jgi:hypothetical protein